MKITRAMSLLLSVLMVLALFAACGDKAAPGPEVGKWHAEIKLSDISGSMSDEDRLLLSMLAGNIVLEIDAEFFEDGTFTYAMNTDQLEEAIADSVSTVMGLFIQFDVSVFTDRLVEAAFQEVFPSDQNEYSGTYTVSGDKITADDDGELLYFEIDGRALVQTDANGSEAAKFSKVNE